PIYGDDVFGFISSEGTLKVHRRDCPNAANIRERYPYRLIRVDWSGHTGDSLPATLRIVGIDDIGIVTNITSLISKESGANLRNISVDSHDGMFQGVLVITVTDQRQLNAIVKKIRTVKGVKAVERV
ncbi:MAG: RelA/SpoT family protein, partial [Muribaculaceae bacterium]|nr:RelA/SpoT family protein [Muribaculaceae bacterium]